MFCFSSSSSSVWHEGLAVRTNSKGCIKATHMDISPRSVSFSSFTHSAHCTPGRVSYLVLGFTQLVLQFREAEASHSDEVTDHSYKLIPAFPRPALLVLQLLEKGKTDDRRVIFKKETGSVMTFLCASCTERGRRKGEMEQLIRDFSFQLRKEHLPQLLKIIRISRRVDLCEVLYVCVLSCVHAHEPLFLCGCKCDVCITSI